MKALVKYNFLLQNLINLAAWGKKIAANGY